jgi:hypothetical protein
MPENKACLVHLGDLYKSKGDHTMANYYYLNALEIDLNVRKFNSHFFLTF